MSEPETSVAPLSADGAGVKEPQLLAWRCFHCDEVFTDHEAAVLHFGRSEHHEAGCTIDLAAFREMERLVSRYRDEDTDLHREIHRLRSEHSIALRREEEKGYARGLADASPAAALTAPDVGVLTREQAHWLAKFLEDAVVAGADPSAALRAIADGRHVVVSAEVLADARRYAYLRGGMKADSADDTWSVTRWIDNDTQEILDGAELDAAIDAALQRSWTTPTEQQETRGHDGNKS